MKKLKPIYKFNNGNGAVLCNHCRTIIHTGEPSNEVLCSKCFDKLIYKYKTFHERGFIQEEIEELIKLFPVFNMEKYDDAMRGNTCMMTEYKGKPRIVNYHCDVFTGLKCGIENREIGFLEWD